MLRLRRSAAALLLGGAALVAALPAANGPRGNPRVMHGPMVGAVGPHDARLWVRVSGPFAVSLDVSPDPAFATLLPVAPLAASKADDYVVRFHLRDLAPATRYHYRVRVDGTPDHYLGAKPPFSIVTAPAGPARFRVAFGSCFRLQESADDRVWRALAQWAPDLFLWTGDNIYGDALDPDILAEEYRRARDIPALVHHLRHTPQLATWDDHDFGLNNGDRRHSAKAAALAVFERYWANPPRGDSAAAPGAYFRHHHAGVDFFFLDGRYHRDPNDTPDGPGKTFLGPAQLAWLRAGLKDSRAVFKILVCGAGWNSAKGSRGDSWAGFRHERDALFDFLRDERIEGVVLISGDSHVGELNCLPWSARGGYDLYEFVSSPLAQNPEDNWLRRHPELRVRQVFNASPNFGVLDFDPAAPRPVLRFQLVDAEGRAVWPPLELFADELRNGVATWEHKLDRVSLDRHRRAAAGRSYYP